MYRLAIAIFAILLPSCVQCSNKIPTHNPKYNYQQIQPHEVANNYQLLKLTDEVLRKHKINYWAYSGTLLGAVRHKGFIPWDLDTDICIFEEDLDRLLACADDFKMYDGYLQICQGRHTHYRVKRIKKRKELFGHVDIFLMKYIDGLLCYSYDPLEHTHYFIPSEIENLIRISFGPITINAPADCMPYLLRSYGEDVMEYAEIPYTINSRTKKKYEKFKITNFAPAIYEVIDFSIPLNDTPLFE
jgi:hypothetical protein